MPRERPKEWQKDKKKRKKEKKLLYSMRRPVLLEHILGKDKAEQAG